MVIPISGSIIPPKPDAREIGVEMLLLDQNGGVPLWTAAFSDQVVWYRDPTEIIDGLTRTTARNFPYQE